MDYHVISEIINKVINEQSNKCSYNWQQFTYDEIDGSEQILTYREVKQRPSFIKEVEKAVNDYIKQGKESEIWRVDVPSLEWLENAKMFVTEKGSTFAIRRSE